MSLRRRRLLQLLPAGPAAPLVGVAAARAATPGVELPPLPGPQRPLVVPAVAEQRLPNGLVLLVVPRPGTPLVSAALHMRAGRDSDERGGAGRAAMTAQLLTKGARRGSRAVDATTLARQAEALGSALDVSSGWRVSSLAMTVTTPKLPQALALIGDVARAPLLQGEELERLRLQTLDSLAVTLANPGDVSGLAARRLFWGDSVYGGSASPGSVKRLQLDDVQRLHQRLYRPERSVLVLAGDIDTAAALRLAGELFGAWTAEAVGVEPSRVTGVAKATQRVLVTMPGSGQSGVIVAAPYAALRDADRRIAEVAAALLGGGYSARLNQEVRIKRGLSYGAGGAGESHEGGGMFTAQAQTQHATAREVAALMREELIRVAQQEAPREELAARQAALVGSFARQLETSSGLAAQVASQYFQGRPVSELARFADDVLAVTPAQVKTFAERLWVPQTLRTVIAGDLKSEADEHVVPIAELDLDEPLLSR